MLIRMVEVRDEALRVLLVVPNIPHMSVAQSHVWSLKFSRLNHYWQVGLFVFIAVA